MSKRTDIRDRVVTDLEAVESIKTVATERVHHSRLAGGKFPWACVVMGGDTREPPAGGQYTIEQPVRIFGYVKGTQDSLEALLKSIEDKLHSDSTLGGHVIHSWVSRIETGEGWETVEGSPLMFQITLTTQYVREYLTA